MDRKFRCRQIYRQEIIYSEKNRMIENDLFNYQIVNNFILQPYEQYNYNPNKNRYLYQPRNYY